VENSYPKCKLEFLGIANIHAMRSSVDRLSEVIYSPSTNEANWFGMLQDSQWLFHIRLLMASALKIVYHVEELGHSVLIHCSDGWDRTSQLSALSQLMLDPYYRTFAGIKVLIEKDWLAFGHMFRDRIWNPVKTDQRSPVFLQFLDCVWQLLKQFPTEFQFNEDYLLALADAFDSGWFAEFCFNSEKERTVANITETGISIWSHLKESEKFQSVAYQPKKKVLVPVCSLRTLQLWARYFHRHDSVFYPKFITESGTDSHVDLPQDQAQAHVLWVPNDSVSECPHCSQPFTMFRRKHHCRKCGLIFCSNCTEFKKHLPQLGYVGEQKVCKNCFAEKEEPATTKSSRHEDDD